MKANTNTSAIIEAPVVSPTTDDFKTALMIVSILVNLFVLTTWLVIQASPSYALNLVSLG